jgi:hypothetical protein
MANNQQNTSSTNSGPLIKGMVKDTDDSYTPEGSWFHARNATPYSRDGNLGALSNESSNLLCALVPYTIIGVIHLYKDVWFICSTDNTLSEMGVFEEGKCTYTPLKNCKDQAMNPVNCLNFKTTNLIIGVSKVNADCTTQVYFADRLNPDRTVTIEKPAFKEICAPQSGNPGCLICDCTVDIDCDAIRLAPLVTTPCLTVSRGPQGGSVINGSYYALVAYVLNSQRVTDYFMPSNVQSIFDHDNITGALQIDITQMDTTHFDQFELVIVRFANSQTSAKKMGIYSTRQKSISVDTIAESLESVPLEYIPIRTPSYEKSDGIFEVGEYMLRTGPKAKFDFNYQPLANRITTKWQAVTFPADYYVQTGNETGYFRDEVYPFFIRWIYNTADKSSSYHIPGRPAIQVSPGVFENSAAGGNPNALDPTDKYFEVVNTGADNITPYNANTIGTLLSNGGRLIAEGRMGYWESTEIYPDKKPDVFNASAHPWSTLTLPPSQYPGTVVLDYDLCGKPIRHHKFPDNKTIPHFRDEPGTSGVKQQIITLGVDFDNILPPVDNNGVLVPGIVGYEILRGSREGNKTVIAKGIINNMKSYDLGTNQVGLYPNYPYNSLQDDPFLAPKENLGENPLWTDHGPMPAAGHIARNQFTFHSPDTSFNTPFLSSKELKIYGEAWGSVDGSFAESPKHPKEKLVTDVAFIAAAIIGIGEAIIAMRGKKTETSVYPGVDYSNVTSGIMAGATNGFIVSPSLVPAIGANAAQIGITSGLYVASEALYTGATVADGTTNLASALAKMFSGIDPAETITYPGTATALLALPGTTGFQKQRVIEDTTNNNIPLPVRALTSATLFSHYWTIGTDAAMDLITAIIPYTQYALRYTSHGYMKNFSQVTPSTYRYQLTNALYLDNGFQEFGENQNAKINNLLRSKTVAIQTLVNIGVDPPHTDNSTQTVGTSIALRQANPNYDFTPGKGPYNKDNIKIPFTTQCSSYYTGLKYRMRNQYGQLDGVIQVPVSTCLVTPSVPLVAGTVIQPTAGPLFNGDTYIGRYTEKNTFFYFWDWLYDQPEGFEFDYSMRYMLNYPRYWANFTKFDPGAFINSFVNSILTLSFNKLELPSKMHSLDGPLLPPGFSFFTAIFRVTERYFYLFNSGVRDFFVESEINVSLRDWEEPIEKRYYDPYRFHNLDELFDPKIIKAGNFFKYDQSLSVSRVFNNFFSWGNLQRREYDPFVAETCYSYYPYRLLYSMPQQDEGIRDFWRVFLANNYKDFGTKITAVKSVNMTGSAIMFEDESPVMFTGVDTLQSNMGVEITIGDGGLFNREPQSIVNTDVSYEYGSCQDRLSVLNTKFGLFWISQNQGKIFQYTNQLEEISLNNMWFWLAQYLPYKLTKQFPNFDLKDNPIAGIGCQTIYDNQEDLLYFCKKDYQVKPQYIGQIIYTPGTGFSIGGLPILIGDSTYFDNASWTLSYNPRLKSWVSFHDWHPDLSLPGKNEFLTTVHDRITNQGSIWRHNARKDSFCNFYGVDHPFEIDRIAQTSSMVNTLRSVEYYMEAYIYKQPTDDIYEVLDANFDHATIYNREQVSGMLILNQMPKNSVAQRLLYPIINPTSIDILADKVEQKYRFNQFWDITADRGEFTFPNVQRPIWNTQPNGYIRDLNPSNMNYQKNSFQRKKFRHYANHLRLYKNTSGNINYVVKLINAKELVSQR